MAGNSHSLGLLFSRGEAHHSHKHKPEKKLSDIYTVEFKTVKPHWFHPSFLLWGGGDLCHGSVHRRAALKQQTRNKLHLECERHFSNIVCGAPRCISTQFNFILSHPYNQKHRLFSQLNNITCMFDLFELCKNTVMSCAIQSLSLYSTYEMYNGLQFYTLLWCIQRKTRTIDQGRIVKLGTKTWTSKGQFPCMAVTLGLYTFRVTASVYGRPSGWIYV